MKIVIGGDHAGFPYKDSLKRLVKSLGHEVKDFGTRSPDSVDYPDYIHPLCAEIENGNADFGIALCGSGNGVAMTANKHSEIRAALCWKVELAALSRQHNNANVLAIPVRFVSKTMARNMVRTFLSSEFEGGRHQRRVSKINQC